jgi:hypothetical protein
MVNGRVFELSSARALDSERVAAAFIDTRLLTDHHTVVRRHVLDQKMVPKLQLAYASAILVELINRQKHETAL